LTHLEGDGIDGLVWAAVRGKEALFEIIAWKFIEFAYHCTFRPTLETINMPWDEALIEAEAQHKQQQLA